MYKHGIEAEEKKTTYERPLATSYGVQVVVGTAPVNLIKNPKEAVNCPVMVQSFEEAVKKLGYTDDWSYTLCQSMYASFQMFNVYPVIYINVLDPDKHSKETGVITYSVSDHQVELKEAGILLNTIKVNQGTGEMVGKAKVDISRVGETSSAPILVVDKDYIVSFNDKGKVILTLLSTGVGYAYDSIEVQCRYLEPDMVTEEEIIGAYNLETGEETGLELVRRVYPHVPSLSRVNSRARLEPETKRWGCHAGKVYRD